LYIKDGHLRFHYNAAGTRSSVTSTTVLPAGLCTATYRFEKTGNLHGIGFLLLDDVEIGSAPIGPTIGVTFAPLGLSIGASRASSITPDYEGSFPFAGTLHQVIITIGNDQESTNIPNYMND